MDDPRSSVIEFCVEISNDPSLVQGAGGNVSWKNDGTLWVKASGTWLADAAADNIFVPVDLDHLQKYITAGNFSVQPRLTAKSGLKPSIETLLHALMPHPVVVHLHAIDILAYLVRHDCENELALRLGNTVSWAIVDYFKPGTELAVAIKDALDNKRDARIIFLKNHGVVIGGSDVGEVRQTLNSVIGLLRRPIDEDNVSTESRSPIEEYAAIDDQQLHRLATDARLFARLKANWALYPDHAVFLGPRAHLYNSLDELKNAPLLAETLPELVFVRGAGVFVTKSFNKTKVVQLRCYYDVLVRQPQGAKLMPLTSDQVSDLLNRDDEKYRIRFAKQ